MGYMVEEKSGATLGPAHEALVGSRSPPHLTGMTLDLTDEETAALTQELRSIVENDRYPFSPGAGIVPALSLVL
jgi:hypothetical protein